MAGNGTGGKWLRWTLAGLLVVIAGWTAQTHGSSIALRSAGPATGVGLTTATIGEEAAGTTRIGAGVGTGGWIQAAGGPRPPRRTATKTYALQVVERACAAIKQYRLSERECGCLAFEPTPGPADDVWTVEVREKHDEKCGGDPMTAPRLFTLEINVKTNEVASDAHSLTGEIEPLH